MQPSVLVLQPCISNILEDAFFVVNYSEISLRKGMVLRGEKKDKHRDLCCCDCCLLSPQAKSILRGFLDDSGQEIASLKSFDLLALDASLCTLNSTEIASINATEFR